MESTSDGVYQQSAAIPYIRSDDEFRVVLVTNSRRSAWIYPKGVIEPNMSAADSAAKEAYEEAGVLGEVEDILLNTYSYRKWGGLCVVEVYPMAVAEVLEDWDEKGLRERRIVDFNTALSMIKSQQKDGLISLMDYLEI